MGLFLKFSQSIDRMTDFIGRMTFWLTLAMVVMGAFNAVARYVSKFIGVNLSSNAFIEAQWYMFSMVFLLGGAYALRHGAHVRVDVLYGRVSRRAQNWINLFGALVFLIPFCIFMLAVTWHSVLNSWLTWEQSPDPGGLPRFPIKTVVPLAICLLMAQGFSEIIKNVAFLRGLVESEEEEPAELE